MENNKYFTPEISNIKIGYECEMNGYPYLFDRGFQITYPKDDTIWEYGDLDMDSIHFLLSNRNWNKTKLRVPYLTKEQIEKEGWEYNVNYESVEYVAYELGFLKELSDNKTQFMAYYNPENHHLRIEKVYDCGVEGWIYRGECKDVNTFRWICKLLRI